MSRRVRGPSAGTVLAWLGVIGTILGILGFFISDLPTLFGGEAATPSSSDVVNTLVALERAKVDAEFQLTQIALDHLQAANQSTQQAIAQQQANVQATIDAAETQQADAIATSNAISAMTSTVDAANALGTQQAESMTATANALAQLAPTSTPTPTVTPAPEFVADHRSIQSASVSPGNGGLVFEMRVGHPIPDAPEEGLTYIWALDTDLNAETGAPLEDIGVDARVLVTFTGGVPLGSVVTVAEDGTTGEPLRFSDINSSGNNLGATLANAAELGLPTTFFWSARVEVGDQTFQPFFPATGHETFQP